MTKLYLRKMPGGTLVPDDDEAVEWLQGVKTGDIVKAEVTRPRNYRFLRKYMALLRLAFDSWEMPDSLHNGLPVQKSFTRFRKDVAIACGFYELTVNIRGETRAEAKSISFANMTEEDFNDLYQKTITLFISKYRILTGYADAAEVDRIVEELLRFA